MSVLSFKFSYWRFSVPLWKSKRTNKRNKAPLTPSRNISVVLKTRDPGTAVEFFYREPCIIIVEHHWGCSYNILGLTSTAPRVQAGDCYALIIMLILTYLHPKKHTTLFLLLAGHTAWLPQPPLQWFRYDHVITSYILNIVWKKSLPFLVWHRRTYYPLSHYTSWLPSWYRQT